MDNLHEKPLIRMLMLIIDQKDVKKAARLLQAQRVPSQYLCRGEGTASSEMLDYLGLGSSEKAILHCPVAKSQVAELFAALNDELGLHRPNKGVAFTFPISGASTIVMRLLDEELQQEFLEHIERSEKKMANEQITHSLLLVMINQGYSEDAMEAARGAGATGGTVVRSRRLGMGEPLKKWGISVQEEKEMIYILAEQDQKRAIMKAIGESCGLHTEAQGVVISIPVDAVTGLSTSQAQ